MRFIFGLIAALTLLACVTAPAAAETRLRTISYRTGPCLGSCPVYRVTVNADGTALFEGRLFTAVAGERRFRITSAQFRAFAARLAPDRPAQGERHYVGETCRQMTTDQSSVEIIWRGTAVQKLDVYFGCDTDANQAMFDRLARAPDLLPISGLIGGRQ